MEKLVNLSLSLLVSSVFFIKSGEVLSAIGVLAITSLALSGIVCIYGLIKEGIEFFKNPVDF